MNFCPYYTHTNIHKTMYKMVFFLYCGHFTYFVPYLLPEGLLIYSSRLECFCCYFGFQGLFCCCFGGTPGNYQGLILGLHSGITPVVLQKPYRRPEIEPRLATYKTSALPTVILLWPQIRILSLTFVIYVKRNY